jgi:hypothetical protein
MHGPTSTFALGPYRPIYLWGGPGTIRMNRLKFMDVPVDESIHLTAHTPEGADRIVNGLRCNWVHLMYDWGFPPEVEAEDWQDFARAASAYHAAGTEVFAYIQTSNCVYAGTFRDEDWYARDPRGSRITYFTYSGRYMACLAHPAWKQHLQDLVRGAIERGADGIFFDNLFQGDQPLSLLGTWLGAAGCHCPRCQEQYLAATGEPIPAHFRPEDPGCTRYLRWRAGQVTHLLAELAAYARHLQPGTPISANDFDPILRNSYLVYGIDLQALAQVQDITMIENFGLPRWEARPRPRLANNALTLRTARALVGSEAHLSILSYDVGIGFDPVYPPRRYRQGIAEAAACGASMTTKGTEYHDGTRMTLLTADEYAPIHATLRHYHTWLEAQAGRFAADRQNAAPVGLLFPGETLWLDWHRLAPLYFGAGQALTANGIPWRVVRSGDPWDGLQVLLAFADPGLRIAPGIPVVRVSELDGWQPPRPSAAVRSGPLRAIVTAGARAALRAYSDVKLARWAMDAAGLQKLVTQTPLYHIPPPGACAALLAALPPHLYPRLNAPQPSLVEVWHDREGIQVHLVNYATNPQTVEVDLGSPVTGRILSPDAEYTDPVEGTCLQVPLDVYTILLLRPAGA